MFHSGVFRIFLAAHFLGSQLQAVTISHTEAGKHVGQEVEVTGTVEMQNEKPKIILRTADSIRISSTAPAAEAPQTTEPAAPAHFVIEALDAAPRREAQGGEGLAALSRGKFLGIREAGVKNVRHESQSGRGGLDPAGFAQALDWFAGPE